MAALDAVGDQGAESGEVLSQTDRRHHFGEFARRLHLGQTQVHGHRGVGLERAADDADPNGELDLAGQRTVLGLGPSRQRGVVGTARRIGVGPGFHRPPVVAGRESDGVDAVHDALVVGRRSVGVDGRELAGDDDAVAHLLAVVAVVAEVLDRDLHLGSHQRAIGQIRQNPEEDLAAGDTLDERSDAFAHGVDQIGAHGVAGVDQKVDHHHFDRCHWWRGE